MAMSDVTLVVTIAMSQGIYLSAAPNHSVAFVAISEHAARECSKLERPRTAVSGNPFDVGRSTVKKPDNKSKTSQQLNKATSMDNAEPTKINITKRMSVGTQQFIAFVDPGSDRSLVRASVAHLMGDVQYGSTIIRRPNT